MNLSVCQSQEDDSLSVEVELPSVSHDGKSVPSPTCTEKEPLSVPDRVLSEPILVGYAFGPKKMSTMGVVMAEASKAKLSTSTTAEAVIRVHRNYSNADKTTATATFTTTMLTHRQQGHNHQHCAPADGPTESCSNANARSSPLLTTEALTSHQEEEQHATPLHDDDDELAAGTPHNNSSTSSSVYSDSNVVSDQNRIVFHMDGGLHNIVRYFRSSCSSVNTNSTTTATTNTTGLSPNKGATPGSTATAPTAPSSAASQANHTTPIRVNFVPLDPNLALEEQHGGHQLDIILHKLTEDILLCSQLGISPETYQEPSKPHEPPVDSKARQAVARVQRLLQYQADHPTCCLLDHPAHVQTLMSRSDIANVLQDCLVEVSSASGLPVRAPRFVVYNGEQPPHHDIQYPLIAKPLTAAGTKQSHQMAVLLQPTALDQIHKMIPCLLQEYANHNATLYKVYVLGEYLFVYKRNSLPNLPTHACSAVTHVEFDSQRPYPRLSDFGFDTWNDTGASTTEVVTVNEQEVRPIVDTLKRALQLEVFGFDIIVTKKPEILVVDVNYFPSYKEVPYFPSLLAQYLTQRAIEARLQQHGRPNTIPHPET